MHFQVAEYIMIYTFVKPPFSESINCIRYVCHMHDGTVFELVTGTVGRLYMHTANTILQRQTGAFFAKRNFTNCVSYLTQSNETPKLFTE